MAKKKAQKKGKRFDFDTAHGKWEEEMSSREATLKLVNGSRRNALARIRRLAYRINNDLIRELKGKSKGKVKGQLTEAQRMASTLSEMIKTLSARDLRRL
jgi:hypothetical protein